MPRNGRRAGRRPSADDSTKPHQPTTTTQGCNATARPGWRLARWPARAEDHPHGPHRRGEFTRRDATHRPLASPSHLRDGHRGSVPPDEIVGYPSYTPGDRKVYLDLTFYHQLKRMGASGDFAWAYVLAHEVGHHVQNLLGTADQVRQLQMRTSRTQANALSVRMELQADCYAGVWAHHAHQQRQILEEGDIEEGLGAAAAVGDDRIQRSAGRRVHPESFTHGTSEQRAQWFIRGLKTGDLNSCNTFES